MPKQRSSRAASGNASARRKIIETSPGTEGASYEQQSLSRLGSLATAIFGDVTARVPTFSIDTNPQATYDAMEKDPIVRMCQNFQVEVIKSCDFSVEGPNPRTNAVIEEALRPHYQMLASVYARSAVPRGFGPVEPVWEDGPMTITYELDDESEDVEQLAEGDPTPGIDTGAAPPTILPTEEVAKTVTETIDVTKIARFINIQPNNVYAIGVDGHENFAEFRIVSPLATLRVENGSCLLFTHNARWGNYFGEAELAVAYEAWMCKLIMREHYMRYMERFGTPPVSIGFPPGVTGEGTQNQAIALGMARDLTNGGRPYVIYPTTDSVNHEPMNWVVEFLKTQPGGGAQFVQALEWLDRQISYALLTPEKVYMGTGTSGGASGSYALSQTSLDVALMTIDGKVDEFLNQLNKQLIPLIVLYTFGPDEPAPRVISAGVTNAKRERLEALMPFALRNDPNIVDWKQAVGQLGYPAGEGNVSGQVVVAPTDPSKGTAAIDMSEGAVALSDMVAKVDEARSKVAALKNDAQAARLAEAVRT